MRQPWVGPAQAVTTLGRAAAALVSLPAPVLESRIGRDRPAGLAPMAGRTTPHFKAARRIGAALAASGPAKAR